MIIFLYGEDSFRSRQTLNEIVAKYKKTQTESVNYISFDFSVDNPKYINSKIDTESLFPEKKFIVCKNVFFSKENKEYFLNFLKENDFRKDNDIVILFYENAKPDEKDEFFKFLKGISKFQEFKNLNRASLNQWIKKEAESRGASCDFATASKLADIFGGNLWRISSEIDKLAAYDKKISLENIGLMVKKAEELNIFELLDGLGAKNRKKALTLLEKYFNEGEKETYILAMISGQFRNLAKVGSLSGKTKNQNEIAKISGIHPYVVKKSLQKLNNFSGEKIKKIYSEISKADFSIKTGRQNPKVALNLLVLKSTE